jgi:hypothetical protein
MSKTNREFTHIVLTRFNVAIDYASTVKGLDTAWLRKRLKLFDRYCVRSVAKQRNAEFEWFVFCNADSPTWFKQAMEEYGRPLRVVYVRGVATDQVIAQKVRESGCVASPYLITTRIDNDDAMASGHLSIVQEAFQNQEREFITFPFGLQLYRGHLYNTYYPYNPFLSLIERVRTDGSFTTVLCVPHPEVCSAGRVRRLWSPPQWLQVLHTDNVGNTLQGWPCAKSRRRECFDVDWPQDAAADSFARRAAFSLDIRVKRVQRLFGKLASSQKPTHSHQHHGNDLTERLQAVVGQKEERPFSGY